MCPTVWKSQPRPQDPPGCGSASKTTKSLSGRRPISASVAATVTPGTPAPMTTRSISVFTASTSGFLSRRWGAPVRSLGRSTSFRPVGVSLETRGDVAGSAHRRLARPPW
ncbi:hypothetical protein ACFPRL_21865 [Pseudoclavibacter helvolus]